MSTPAQTFEVVVPMHLSADHLRDVLTTAAEGGIGYWAEWSRTVRQEDLTVAVLVGVRSYDDEGETPVDLNAAALVPGVVKILARQVSIRDDLYRQVATLLTDDPDVDADAADCIVQAAIYGELVYG